MAQDGPKMALPGPQHSPKTAHVLKEKPKRGNWVALGGFGLLWSALAYFKLQWAA